MATKRAIAAAFVTTLMLASCSDAPNLEPGDLLFVSDDNSEFSSAIVSATGRADASFSHVGIYIKSDGQAAVIEALPRKGVCLTPLDSFLNENVSVVGMRLINKELCIQKAVKRALCLVGRQYDWEFAPGDSAIYCSELVQLCYLDEDGNPIFESEPMNFKNADGEMPEFWISLFAKMGKEIPQGAPGTNPNSIFNSDKLEPMGWAYKRD